MGETGANSLDILVILDRSGSMQQARSDHEEGLRSFVKEQRKLPGEVKFTLVQFDSGDPCEVVYDRAALADVKPISLLPRGSTPLLDAIGMALARLVEKQTTASTEQTVVLIITDGQENASKEWTKAKVAARIADLERQQWKFIFLGANVDAFAEARDLGIRARLTLDYSNTPAGVGNTYAAVSDNMISARTLRSKGATLAVASAGYDFSDEQRKQAVDN